MRGMANVVDIFALPVPRKRLAEYRRLSRAVGRIFRRHGITEYREFVWSGDAGMTGIRPFTGGIKLKRGEVLVAAIVGYGSKAARARAMKGLEKDPALARVSADASPFDMKRMTVSVFETIVDVKA